MQGWVSIHRKIINNPVWQDPKLLKLWMLCLLEATHKEHKQLVGNLVIELKPGQFVTGRYSLFSEYNRGAKKKDIVPQTTLWRWMKVFEDIDFIQIESFTKYSIITINNWHFYQHGLENANGQQKNGETPSATKDSENTYSKNGQQSGQQMDRKMDSKVDRSESESNPDVPTDSGNEFFRNGQQIGTQIDTNNNVLKEGKKEGGRDLHQNNNSTPKELIVNKYLQRRAHGFDLTAEDEQAIDRLLKDDIPTDKILLWIDEIFDEFKPKHRLDRIKHFKYLEVTILDKFVKSQEPVVKTGKHKKHNEVDWENL